MARSVPMPASPTAPNPTARNRIRDRASLMPASAKARRRAATAMRRAAIMATRRVLHGSTGTTVRRAVLATGPIAGRARIFARATAAARSVRIRRVKVVKNGPTHRVVIAAMRALRRVSPTRNSATSGRIRRAAKVARSDPTRRVARVSARMATVRVATGPLPLVHAMAIAPKENSAATRNFRAARRTAARARTSATVRIAADRPKPWQKRDASSPDHAGRNSRPPRDGARNFDKPRFDKPRDERGGDERPRFSRPREDRPQGGSPAFRPAARAKRSSEIRSSA